MKLSLLLLLWSWDCSAGLVWLLSFSSVNSSQPSGLQPSRSLCWAAEKRLFRPMGRKGFVSAWREGSGDGDEEQHAFHQTMRRSALLLP